MKIYVIPATYNESENIEEFITVLEEEVFPQIKNHDMHILVADDYSPDKTGDIVKKLMKKYKNLGLNQGERKGLGAAYLRAMGHAIEKLGADYVISIDADFQFDPRDLPKYIAKIDEGYEMVVQTRYSQGGSIPQNWPIQRKIFSIIANLFVRLTFFKLSVHDWTGGFRAIKKDVFLRVRPKVLGRNGYIFQIAFLHEAVAAKFKIAEVPLHFTDRKLGMSKIAPLNYIKDVLTFVILTRIKELMFGSFGKFLVVGGIGFVTNLTIYYFLAKHLNFNLVVANTIGAEIAIFSNYNLNNLWTFKHHRKTDPWHYLKGMALFFLTSNIGVWIWQNGTIYLGDQLFGRDKYLLYWLFGTGLLLVWNFTIYSRFIWKTHN
jgi:dolichol-phosphate mannosyltransferase